jgi:hypothetical protein
MLEAPENGKESSHSAHANGMNKLIYLYIAVHEHNGDVSPENYCVQRDNGLIQPKRVAEDRFL